MLGVLVAAYPGSSSEGRGRAGQYLQDGSDEEKSDKKLVRDYLLPGAPDDHVFSAKSIGRLLKKHLDNVVLTDDGGTLVLRKREEKGATIFYRMQESCSWCLKTSGGVVEGLRFSGRSRVSGMRGLL